MMPETKSYPKDTAGKLIATNIPVFYKNEPIYQAIEQVLNQAGNYASINYVYIVDQKNKLIGTASIKELLAINKEGRNQELGIFVNNAPLISVHPYSHQERAAQLAVKHNIKCVPVLNKEGVLLGIIDSDHVLSIMHEEKVEDLLKFAGVSKEGKNLDNFLAVPTASSLKHRLPWLIVGLFGGLFMSHTITKFEHILNESLLVAAFIPMVVYMSSAVGQQITAFFIRDSALNDSFSYLNYFVKQFTEVVMIAMIIGLLLFGASYLLYGDSQVSLALGLSMFGTISSSILTGFLLPFILIKSKQDPANGSGPIGTVLQDVLSVVIYLFFVSILF